MKFIFSILVILVFNNFQYAFSQSDLLRTVYFGNNSYHVSQKYAPLLTELANIIKADSCSIIRIIGYADPTGSIDYNEYLSEKRADAVYHSLLSFVKIDTVKIRVHIESNGDSAEWYDLHLKGAHIQQRCVDILLEFR